MADIKEHPRQIGGRPKRDGILNSVWQSNVASYQPSNTSRKSSNELYDVLVVGGGITGITTALRLQERGLHCVLIEAQEIGFGTAGGTTAHINTMLDVSYDEIEQNFGTEGAQAVARATRATCDMVEQYVSKYGIDCDFTYKDGVLFARDEKETKALESIYEASRKAEVDVKYADDIPEPWEWQKAINYTKQIQIHPLKYIHALARQFELSGGVILQYTRGLDSNYEDGIHHLKTNNGPTIRGKQVIYATHIPPGINVLHFRCAPYRSYVLAAQVGPSQYLDALVYDMDKPYHYLRSHIINGTRYLLVGGADHKVGHGDPESSFRALEDYLRRHFEVSAIDYRWSAQYFESSDGLPYIGKLPGADEGTYVATGFGGNGILFGSFSALLLVDLICSGTHPHESLFSPSRIKPVAGFTKLVKENADVVYRFITDRLRGSDISEVVDLPADTGMIFRVDGRKIALYKSLEGELTALSPVCTHAGCIVVWNNVEKSWDCPCHGGRYDITGHILTGPPRNNLEPVPLLK